MWDSVLIQEDYNCPIYVHQADESMVLDTAYVKMFGVVPPIRRIIESMLGSRETSAP